LASDGEDEEERRAVATAIEGDLHQRHWRRHVRNAQQDRDFRQDSRVHSSGEFEHLIAFIHRGLNWLTVATLGRFTHADWLASPVTQA
jgi:hypothetical protein